ncbi:hypothetical protein ACRW2M_22765, partial [Escherichia coli]
MFIEKSDSFLELPSEVIFPEAANAAILKHDKWADVWETLTTDADLNYTDEKETVSLSSLVTSATSAIYQAITDGWTMCVGYSGGKDSHSLLHLFLMALIGFAPIFPDTCYHLTHYWPAAADIPVASDNPVH